MNFAGLIILALSGLPEKLHEKLAVPESGCDAIPYHPEQIPGRHYSFPKQS